MVELGAWLKQRAVPLAGTAPTLGDEDLSPVLDMFGASRLIGLGEASHGAREFFLLKHRIIATLHGHPPGLDQLHFESPLPGVLATRDWVRGLEGTVARALQGLGFGIWQTHEVADLLHWLRSSAGQIELLGIDIQDPEGAVAALDGPGLHLAPLAAHGWHESTVAERSALAVRLRGLDSPLARNLRRWVESEAGHEDGGHEVREKAMADHLLEGLHGHARSAAWAHNGHVSRGGMAGWNMASMGQHLDAALAEDYVAVGFVFGHGRISAYDSAMALGEHVVPRRTDAFHTALAETGPLFAWDLRSMPAALKQQLIESPPPVWDVGHSWYGPEHHERPVDLVRCYDVIIYVDEVTPSRPYFGE